MVRVTSSSVPPTTSLWELKRLHTVNPIVFTIINANFLKRMRSRCYPSSQIHQFSYHICIIMDRIVPSQNDFIIMKILSNMSVCLSVYNYIELENLKLCPKIQFSKIKTDNVNLNFHPKNYQNSTLFNNFWFCTYFSKSLFLTQKNSKSQF